MRVVIIRISNNSLRSLGHTGKINHKIIHRNITRSKRVIESQGRLFQNHEMQRDLEEDQNNFLYLAHTQRSSLARDRRIAARRRWRICWGNAFAYFGQTYFEQFARDSRIIEGWSDGGRNAHEPFLMSDTRSLFNGFYLASLARWIPFLSLRPSCVPRVFTRIYSREIFTNTMSAHLCFPAAIGALTRGPPKLRHKCAHARARWGDECRRVSRIFASPVKTFERNTMT